MEITAVHATFPLRVEFDPTVIPTRHDRKGIYCASTWAKFGKIMQNFVWPLRLKLWTAQTAQPNICSPIDRIPLLSPTCLVHTSLNCDSVDAGKEQSSVTSTLPTFTDCTTRNKVNESHDWSAESFGSSFYRIPLSGMWYFAEIDSIVSLMWFHISKFRLQCSH